VVQQIVRVPLVGPGLAGLGRNIALLLRDGLNPRAHKHTNTLTVVRAITRTEPEIERERERGMRELTVALNG
jgi:hypothetical protein